MKTRFAIFLLALALTAPPAGAQQGTPEIMLLDSTDLFGKEPEAAPVDPVAEAFANCIANPRDLEACAMAQSPQSGLETSAGGGLETVVLDPDDANPAAIKVSRDDPARPARLSASTAAAEPSPGAVVMLEMDLFFDYDSTAIRSGEAGKIREIATALAHPRNARTAFLFIGHTDAKGSNAYNCRLSNGRAEAVVAALGAAGIAADRLVAVGAGEAILKDMANPQGDKNRRVGLATLDAAGAGLLNRVRAICK